MIRRGVGICPAWQALFRASVLLKRGPLRYDVWLKDERLRKIDVHCTGEARLFHSKFTSIADIEGPSVWPSGFTLGVSET